MLEVFALLFLFRMMGGSRCDQMCLQYTLRMVPIVYRRFIQMVCGDILIFFLVDLAEELANRFVVAHLHNLHRLILDINRLVQFRAIIALSHSRRCST